MKIDITLNGETKKVNFTKPQAAIMERLLSGEKVTMINTHWMNGGEFVWHRNDGYEWGKEYVGYRAFNGAMYAIKTAFNLKDCEFKTQWFL